jgi:hypothetical protein
VEATLWERSLLIVLVTLACHRDSIMRATRQPISSLFNHINSTHRQVLLGLINPTRMRWAGHVYVAGIWQMRHACTFLLGKSERRGTIGEDKRKFDEAVGVDVRWQHAHVCPVSVPSHNQLRIARLLFVVIFNSFFSVEIQMLTYLNPLRDGPLYFREHKQVTR